MLVSVCVLCAFSPGSEADKPCLFLSLYNPLECQHDDKPMSMLLCDSASESQGKHIGHLPLLAPWDTSEILLQKKNKKKKTKRPSLERSIVLQD